MLQIWSWKEWSIPNGTTYEQIGLGGLLRFAFPTPVFVHTCLVCLDRYSRELVVKNRDLRSFLGDKKSLGIITTCDYFRRRHGAPFLLGLHC